MTYPLHERETTLNFDAVTKEWTAYSTVTKHINKLIKKAGEPYWSETEVGETGTMYTIAGKWKLTSRQISFLNTGKPAVKALEEVNE